MITPERLVVKAAVIWHGVKVLRCEDKLARPEDRALRKSVMAYLTTKQKGKK